MTDKEMDYAAQIFRAQAFGTKPTISNRVFLQRLLDEMNESESAGIVAAIIRITLEEKS